MHTLDERIATNVRESGQNTIFFKLINFIHVHEHQKISEAKTSHVGKVPPCPRKATAIDPQKHKNWYSRANRQLLPINFVAYSYHLDPQHLQYHSSQSEHNLILQFIERYSGPLARQ